MRRDEGKTVPFTSSSEDDEVSQGDEELPLFLRRDIPPFEDAPEIHGKLTTLWEERQRASLELVQALNEDDLTLFEVLEEMRHINQRMHRIKKEYQAQKSPEFVRVDELPLPLPNIGSELKQAYKNAGNGNIQIVLDYEGHQEFRTVKANAPKLDIHVLAYEFLMDISPQPVERFEDFSLRYEGQEILIRGSIDEIPILNGGIVVILFRLRENRTPRHLPSDPVSSSSCRGGSSRGNHHDETHPLTGARAPSRPGTNGGAFLGGSFHQHYSEGYPQEETHPLTDVRAPSRPGNNGGAYVPIYDVRASPSKSSGTYDKLRQAFKCPRFSGQAREWKQWNKGFMRYLSIWDLEYVLDPDFSNYPLSPEQAKDNKLVYYIIEDSVQNAPMAASYVRQAPVDNGFEAYYTLHDGYVFAGSTTSTLLLNELSNFRFLPNETPTALCLRLQELFQELELLPSEAAVTFVDTQKIGYLLNALRHEEEWDVVVSSITSAQIKGTITFRDACEELKVRCETKRVHDLLDGNVKGRKVKGLVTQTRETEAQDDTTSLSDQAIKTFISTVSKRLNLDGGGSSSSTGEKSKKKTYVRKECLAADCDDQSTFPLCGLHYHSLVSAKTQSLKLRNGYGEATYNIKTNLIEYPPRTPADRLPTNKPRKVKAGLVDAKASPAVTNRD